jgi:hypothetical protein
MPFFSPQCMLCNQSSYSPSSHHSVVTAEGLASLVMRTCCIPPQSSEMQLLNKSPFVGYKLTNNPKHKALPLPT